MKERGNEIRERMAGAAVARDHALRMLVVETEPFNALVERCRSQLYSCNSTRSACAGTSWHTLSAFLLSMHLLNPYNDYVNCVSHVFLFPS